MLLLESLRRARRRPKRGHHDRGQEALCRSLLHRVQRCPVRWTGISAAQYFPTQPIQAQTRSLRQRESLRDTTAPASKQKGFARATSHTETRWKCRKRTCSSVQRATTPRCFMSCPLDWPQAHVSTVAWSATAFWIGRLFARGVGSGARGSVSLLRGRDRPTRHREPGRLSRWLAQGSKGRPSGDRRRRSSGRKGRRLSPRSSPRGRSQLIS